MSKMTSSIALRCILMLPDWAWRLGLRTMKSLGIGSEALVLGLWCKGGEQDEDAFYTAITGM